MLEVSKPARTILPSISCRETLSPCHSDVHQFANHFCVEFKFHMILRCFCCIYIFELVSFQHDQPLS